MNITSCGSLLTEEEEADKDDVDNADDEEEEEEDEEAEKGVVGEEREPEAETGRSQAFD